METGPRGIPAGANPAAPRPGSDIFYIGRDGAGLPYDGRVGFSFSAVPRAAGRGAWLVEVGGREFVVSGRGPLKSGERHSFRVELDPSGKPFLRHLRPERADVSRLRSSEASVAPRVPEAARDAGRAAAALAFFGHPASDAAVARVRRSAARVGGPAAYLAAAAVEAKGLELAEGAFADVVAAVGSGGEGAGEREGPGDGSRGRGKKGRGEGGGSGGGQDDKAPTTVEAARMEGRAENGSVGIEALAASLRSAGSADGALGFFNRVPLRDGRLWIVFPARYAKENVDIKASVRILLGTETAPGVRPVERLVVDADAGSRSWSFDATGPAGRGSLPSRLSVWTDAAFGAGSAGTEDALRGALSSLGFVIEVDAGSRRPELFLGAEAPAGIDALA